jgi:predicted  nucleic acid-binding Zn-ribbon protein
MNIDWVRSLQRLFALSERLDAATAELERERQERQRFVNTVAARPESLDRQLSEIRERITRLEAYREADRSHLDAEISRLKLEAERALMRLSQVLSQEKGVPELPDQT